MWNTADFRKNTQGWAGGGAICLPKRAAGGVSCLCVFSQGPAMVGTGLVGDASSSDGFVSVQFDF